MKNTGRMALRVLLAVLVFLASVVAFWFGLVPQRFSPFPPITLDERPGWFVDPRLSALRYDRDLCLSVMKTPHVDATAIPDNPLRRGCGWINAVRFSQTGGARIGVDKLTCETAAALTLWMEHEIQPMALEMFGKRVASLGDMGTYDCRNIVGNPFWRNTRSQHATANAIDISGFTLEDGRSISVLRDWRDKGLAGRFLREAHRKSCRYFRVSLGPDFNRAHRNHFHFDRGLLWTCK